ncbi:type II toxin-antitoxin system VapC family toxin [Natrialba swarupiae]|uniref:Type II toxin-antitoxin system VapC family toxin n=1 Tax=Natrialba swarupiae TaxID=2448032 RepID=A0A5D5AIU2_9EURY|nr:PIN domain-containing protein [Natrialba swarupiae]MCW8173424.1 PIN domain-containing protein [Natrialba swarupiae]TYT61699.1 type II toxin-antitoxin system VapC family toxin [Natrialba swarupiae]
MAPAPEPLFIDTAAFFARFNERATEHERATAVFDGIRSGTLRFDPLFTSQYVLSELATLILRKVSHRAAVNALETIRTARSFNVLPVGGSAFDRSCEQFAKYDDQQISFVDHSSAVLAVDRGIDHVFTFGRSDFRTLGFTVVPDDI